MRKFEKGESGNPGGRPTGSTMATLVRKDIEQALPGILAGSVAKFVFDEFFVFYVIDFIVLSFSFLPQKLNFATEPC
jgi:hypothetical protein